MGKAAYNQVMNRITDSIESVQRNSQTRKYFDFAKSDLKTVQEQGIQADILNNTKRIMDSAEAAEFMKVSNFGPYLPELWPIVTAWYPEFPIKDLVSVQTMNQPLGYIAISQLRTGTSKAPTVAGQLVETPTGLRTINGFYPTGEIQDEQLAAEDFVFDTDDKTSTAALAYYPLQIGMGYLEKFMVKITSTDPNLNGKWVASHESAGVVLFKKDGVANTLVSMDIQTGALIIKDDTAVDATTVTAASVFYVWDIQDATEKDVPTVNEDITIKPIEARPRAMGIKWSIFSEYVKKAQFGIDIRTDITQRVLNLMYQIQTRYIIDTMYNYSTQDEVEIVLPTGNITVESKCQELLMSLNEVAQKIAVATGRMYGNRLVVGQKMRSFFESLPNTYFTKAKYDENGYESARELGEFGPFKVFYDPQLGGGNYGVNSDKGLMTYKGTGNSFFDAAGYYGVFLPLISTDLVQLTVTVRSSFIAMDVFLLDKPFAVVPLKFV